MKQKKVDLRFFTVMDYDKEAEYLSRRHREGWKFSYVTFPGLYHFVKIQPEDVRYQLDYNKDSELQHDEYIRMFEDCGWEYMMDYVGYSYFRKPACMMEGDEEIFCDDESRLDMIRRVFMGRIIPLIIIFCCIIIPNLIRFFAQGGQMVAMDQGLYVTFLVLAVIYLVIFFQFSLRYYQFMKQIGR